MTDNYFDNRDKEISNFLDQLIKRTENNFLIWRPLSRYFLECQNNPHNFEDYIYYPECYNDIVEMINSKSTIRFYKEDSFYLEKNDFFIFLIHIKRHSQFNNREDDNYELFGASKVREYLMHICGINKETEKEIENTKKVMDLCNAIKQYTSRWLAIYDGELGPISSLFMNILGD